MARVQILPLPTEKVGDVERTPFVIILDSFDRHDEDFPDAWLEQLKESTGAACIIAHEAQIDAPGNLELTDEQREQLLQRVTDEVAVGEAVHELMKAGMLSHDDARAAALGAIRLLHAG